MSAVAVEHRLSGTAAADEMKIRDAVESDLPAIIKIYNAAIVTRIATAQLETVTLEERHAPALAGETADPVAARASF